MANLRAQNSNGSAVGSAFSLIANNVPIAGTTDPTTQANYTSRGESAAFGGIGFTYDGNGRLVAGVITSVNFQYTPLPFGSAPAAYEIYTGLALTVQQAVAFASNPNTAASVLLAGNDTITANAASVFGYDGNDTISIAGPGTASGATVTTVNGGAGVNTAVFPNALRSAATISGGGGNETVVQSGFTTNLISFDQMRFIDGVAYEDNATPGAQAALIFEGILGRLPDGINAGGFGRVAEQTDTSAVARALLATPEAQAHLAGLSNADFVAGLYHNMLHRDPDAPGAAGWQASLDTGTLDRGSVAASFATTPEAQSANPSVTSGAVFGADPSAVEVLRAYETLLNRLPDANALVANTGALAAGAQTLQQLYGMIQSSSEFQGHQNQYGLSAASSFDAIRSVTVSDQVTALITPLVTSQGISVLT